MDHLKQTAAAPYVCSLRKKASAAICALAYFNKSAIVGAATIISPEKEQATGYYHRVPVAGSDGASFTLLDAHYAKDKAHV
jgi:hypothetical protein